MILGMMKHGSQRIAQLSLIRRFRQQVMDQLAPQLGKEPGPGQQTAVGKQTLMTGLLEKCQQRTADSIPVARLASQDLSQTTMRCPRGIDIVNPRRAYDIHHPDERIERRRSGPIKGIECGDQPRNQLLIGGK
jgi:hypothetical protein